MKISLIITTYNWEAALDLVLRSVARQSRLPDELIIADDGSRSTTKELIEQWRGKLKCPLKHIWHDDLGFRVARIRNLAIAAATGDYIVLADGDMVLHQDFIEDHARAACRGYFMQGVRLITGEATGRRMIEQGIMNLNLLAQDVQRRRHTIRNRLLSWLVRQRTHANQKAIRSCNQGYWRDDLIKVNGFDERMTGWGREDNDIAERLYNAGVKRKNLKFAALAIHLHHPTRHKVDDNPNDAFLKATIDSKSKWCPVGLDQHLRNT
jgi:glycosyltransferase involved in cell wall biosynthesis